MGLALAIRNHTGSNVRAGMGAVWCDVLLDNLLGHEQSVDSAY